MIYKGSVLFRSGFGDGNAADEVALEVERSWFPDHQHIVMVRKPSRNYEEMHPGIVTVERLEHHSFADAKGRNLRGFNYGDSPEIFNYLLGIIEKVSCVVIGHGAYFNTHHNSIARGNLSEMGILVWLAQMVGTPVILTGMSATGLHKAEQWNKTLMDWILGTVTGCIFRDNHSKQSLIDIGVKNAEQWPVLPDALLSYKVSRPPKKLENHYNLLIAPRNVSHVSEGVDKKLTETLVDIATRWVREHEENNVYLVPQLTATDPDDPNDDVKKCFEIWEKCRHDNVQIAKPDEGLRWWDGIMRAYEHGETLISVRHHASIFGILKGVKNIYPFGYDDKVTGFWGSVFAQEPISMEVDPDELWSDIKSGRHFYLPNEPSEKIGMYYKEQIDKFLGR
jgi:polysaccharide pyruvyl transferase WcaK-like protein